jgi:drug/metabolite transporter (DMT)-like permease
VTLGIALGLGAALCWGLADYFAALASRGAGPLRVVFGFNLVAMIPLTALVLASGGLGSLKLDQLPVFVLLGAVGWLSYLAFYGALAIGPISVLSPIVSGYAAVTVVLAVLINGEHLSPGEIMAVTITIAGAMVASANVRDIARSRLERRAALGFLLALTAMVLLGGFVFGISYYHERIGWLGPIFLARGFSLLFLLGHTAVKGDLHPVIPATLLPAVTLLAVLDTAGYICFNVGTRHAATSIVATASAPYALVPVLMGTYLLRERPTATQWSGVALVLIGLVTLGLSA